MTDVLDIDIPPVKRTRKANFSQEELRVLVDGVEKHAYIVNGKLGPQISIEKKKRAWLQITSEVNLVSSVTRGVEEVRTKFKNLKLQSKTKKAAERCGEKVEKITPLESRVIDMMEDTTVKGFNNIDFMATDSTSAEASAEEIVPTVYCKQEVQQLDEVLPQTMPPPSVSVEISDMISFHDETRRPATPYNNSEHSYSPKKVKGAAAKAAERVASEFLGIYSEINGKLSRLVELQEAEAAARAKEVAERRRLMEADLQLKTRLVEILEAALPPRTS